jgi:hypothetical protein
MRNSGIALAIVLAALGGRPALAEEVALKQSLLPVEVNGFIDLAISADATSRSNSFGLSEFELDFKKSFGDIASFRVDVNFRFADATDANGKIVSPNFDQLLEQAFVTIEALKKRTGLSFTAGKFNAPIGFEALDPPDRLQISLSNVFSFLLPFNMLGGMVTWERGPMSLALHVTKGWDVLISPNQSQTFGGRLGISMADGKAVLGLSMLWGPQGERDGNARTVADLDFTLKLWDKLIWGFEANYGTEPYGSGIRPGERASWLGMLSTINWRWLEWLSTTFRWDLVHDPDGALVTPGLGQTRQSLTAALLFTLRKGSAPFGVATGAMAAIEYRADISDASAFLRADGSTGDTRHVIAAKMVYAW